MLFSSAYATMIGFLPPLITERTAAISDEMNHNCIFNAIALARPAQKSVYGHLDLDELEQQLAAAARTCARDRRDRWRVQHARRSCPARSYPRDHRCP